MKGISGKMADETSMFTFRSNVLLLQETSKELTEGNDYDGLRRLFQDIFSTMTNAENCEIDENFTLSLVNLIRGAELQLNNMATPQSDLTSVFQCLTSCFRVCRNLCAFCKSNQTIFHGSENFILGMKSFLSGLQAKEDWSEDVTALLRCSIQFLCNYSSGNLENQQQVWAMFQDLFMYCLNSQDEKLQNYVQMGIHICLSEPASPLRQLTQDNLCWDILHKCVLLAVEEESVNGLFVIEDALKLSGFCENIFNRLDNQLKILVLEVLINQLQQIPEEGSNTDIKPCDIPCISNIQFLTADFVVQSHHIPRMDSLNDSVALYIVKELEGLCLASVHLNLYPCLQEMQQLIKVAISLLQSMEDLGQEGNPVFVNAGKMSDLDSVNQDHPVFGLKRDLIRLLGNLAYKNKANQDLIREQNGISLILNKTNIDGKNPFIVQWSIFAIRNLTEDNVENQQYIADLKLKGVSNNQDVLDEMGLTAEKEGEKVVIKKKD